MAKAKIDNKNFVSLDVARQQVWMAIQTNTPIFLHGSPGIGKSETLQSVGDTLDLVFIDERLSEREATDISGIPDIDHDKGVVMPIPYGIFPTEDWELPEGKKGWLLCLEELTSADESVQKACYRLINDREVAGRKLHEKVYIVAAGNLPEDNAIVETMSTALLSRFIHVYVQANTKTWLKWAHDKGLDSSVTSYISFKNNALMAFDPNTSTPYPCPRTWNFVNRIVDKVKEISPTDAQNDLHAALNMYRPSLEGAIGEGATMAFLAYLKVWRDLPSVDELLANPDKYVYGDDALSLKWAIMTKLAESANKKNAVAIADYLDTLGVEFQVEAFRIINRKNPELLDDELVEWLAKVSDMLA